jgi:hydrogenase maturation protease
MKLLVIGIGQSLRGDDAAGLEAVRLWQSTHPQTAEKVNVILSELPGLGLIDLLDGMDTAILVDAVHGEAEAGMIHHIRLEKLEAFTPGSASAHGWGVAETLELARKLYPQLEDFPIALIGIEAASLEMGAGLSPQVQAALAGAAEMIEREVKALL